MQNQKLEQELNSEFLEFKYHKKDYLFSDDSLPTYMDEFAENYQIENERIFFLKNYYLYAPFECDSYMDFQPSFQKLKRPFFSKRIVHFEQRRLKECKRVSKLETKPLYATTKKTVSWK